MNRPMLAVVAVLVIVGVAIYLTSTNPAGRFSEADTCAELSAMFEAEPVSDDATERKAVGDEYRARFRNLGC